MGIRGKRRTEDGDEEEGQEEIVGNGREGERQKENGGG